MVPSLSTTKAHGFLSGGTAAGAEAVLCKEGRGADEFPAAPGGATADGASAAPAKTGASANIQKKCFDFMATVDNASTYFSGVPITVETTPSGVILRTTPLSASAT